MLLRLFIFALLMLDGFARNQPTVFNCSLIELNHRYNDVGQHCYSQVILWQWDGSVQRHDVVAWWLVEPSALEKLPARTAQGCKVLYVDNTGKQWRVVGKVTEKRPRRTILSVIISYSSPNA